MFRNVLNVLECTLNWRGRHCLSASSMNLFLLTVRFHPLPCFLLMVPSVNLLQQFKCSRLVGKFLDKFLAPYPFSYLSTLIKTWLFAENTMCIVYMISSKHATECLQYAVLETEIFYHRYLKTDYSAILCAYFTWESCALIWIGCVQISHFCGTYTQILELCWVYFFRTWCIYNTLLC